MGAGPVPSFPLVLLLLHSMDVQSDMETIILLEAFHNTFPDIYLEKMWSKLQDIDFYRKIPKDLTEGSAHGSVLSLCAATFMLILFVAELWAFLTTQITTNIIVDPNTESQLRINFNITLLDMPCEFATIDVVDVLGTRNENVTLNINKWQVDEMGIRRTYEGRNTAQEDMMHDTHHDMKLLKLNGLHAVPVNEYHFQSWLEKNEYVFVDFYAPWCVWCQRLEPTWEAFAEKMAAEEIPVSVIKVDCVVNRQLCMSKKCKHSLCFACSSTEKYRDQTIVVTAP